MDALNPNTKLGKAVRAATDELNHLNAMVRRGALGFVEMSNEVDVGHEHHRRCASADAFPA